ncbi:MAG: transglutaminase domain-containing protein [Eubacterium sp.]
MKKVTKIFSVILCLVIALTSMPVSVFAQVNAPANLRCEIDEWNEKNLVWDNVYNYDYYNVYVSSDGINFTLAEKSYDNEYYISSNTPKGIYYYYVTAVIAGWEDYYCDEDGNLYTEYHPDEESAPSNTVAVSIYESITPYCYAYEQKNGNIRIEWSCYNSDIISRIDGFTVYQSTNGGDFVPVSQVSAGSGTIDKYGDYTYSVDLSLSKAPASYKFSVASYTVLGGVMYSNPDFTSYDEYTVYMPDPVLTTKTKSEIIKWKKVSGADSYAVYGGTSYSKIKKLATVSGSKTSYTVKNVDNYKKDYYYYVAAIKNSVEFSRSYTVSSSNGEARMRAAKKSKKKKSTVTVLNTRNSKSSTAWKVTITKKDKKILDNFAKKHFKKGWTDVQKAQYTLEWINKNVKYAYGGKYNKIAKCSYVEAIFSKKCGQCLQYNGAYAMFLTYLGYEARIIQGWRGSSMKNKWSHYWCEIKIDGKWYLMETGNMEDSGSWMYFCQPYRNAGGYLINKKPAK